MQAEGLCKEGTQGDGSAAAWQIDRADGKEKRVGSTRKSLRNQKKKRQRTLAICKDPNASFSEKQDRIMAQIRQQDQHNEQIVDKVVDAGKFITSAAVVGGGVTVLAKEGRKIATACAKTSAVKAFSPAGAIKAACNGIKGIVKAVKK